MQKVCVTLSGDSLEEVQKLAASFALGSPGLALKAQSPEVTEAPVAETPKKKAKKAAPVVEELPEEVDDSVGDEDFSEELADEETEDEEESGPSLDDVLAKVKAYAAANGREKAVKLLKDKFKVKTIHDLKAAQYPSVIKVFSK